MFLNLPLDVILSTPRFRLRVHTLGLKPQHGIKVIPSPDLCDADDTQDDQHFFPNAPIPT
jgi:hypothetical protein